MEKTVEERVQRLESAHDFVGKELAGLRTEIGKVETGLRDDIRQGFSDLRAEIGRLDTKLDSKMDKVFIAIVGGFLLAIVASLLTR
jgi:hypothetical protein